MKTVKELAKERGIKVATFGYRLWEASVSPSKYKVVKGRTVGLYDAALVRRIDEMLRKKPVGKRPGRPRKRGNG